MEESTQGDSPPLPSPSPSPSPSSSSSSSPSSSSPTEGQNQQQEARSSLWYRVNISFPEDPSTHMRDEAWSCLIVLVTFWFFAASMTLILGLYGSVHLQLGPNCSSVLKASSIFVQEIKVKSDNKPGPMLYGFSKIPPLDVETTWSETHNEAMPADFHKEWIYNLNTGSEINVSYSVSENSSPLTLVIAQGKDNLDEWIEDPSYPNTTLSWNIIHGNGSIHQKIVKTAAYYVAVGNLNPEVVEVQLNLRIKSLMYNTTEAYYKCSLDHGLCGLKLFILGANAAVLTTPGPEQGRENNDWSVKLSYGPRWITYFCGSGGMTIIILLAFKIAAKFQPTFGDDVRFQGGEVATERTPLISPKDDDALSYGSSYESVSHDEEDNEDWLVAASASFEGKPPKEGENSNPRRLCTVCFDAPRDCFFLPCGHCATCFNCGTRIAEEASTCPICRRKIKKVRKIFTV